MPEKKSWGDIVLKGIGKVAKEVLTEDEKPKRKRKRKTRTTKKRRTPQIETETRKLMQTIKECEFHGRPKSPEAYYQGELAAFLRGRLPKHRIVLQKGMGGGVIDIAVTTPSKKRIGIEVKRYTSVRTIQTLEGQVRQYLESFPRVIAVIVTHKSIATTREKARRVGKIKRVKLIVKPG